MSEESPEPSSDFIGPVKLKKKRKVYARRPNSHYKALKAKRRALGIPEEVRIDKKLILPSDLPILKIISARGGKVQDMCDYLGMSLDTFYSRLKENPEIDKEIKKAKVSANLRVAESLYDLSVGVRHPETNRFIVPPSVEAAKHWTKTQMGWNEKLELEFSKKDPLEGMTQDQLEEKLRELKERHESKLRLAG